MLILDIGGFVGSGEHTTGVTLDEIKILTNSAGDEVRVYIDSSEEALMRQRAYRD